MSLATYLAQAHIRGLVELAEWMQEAWEERMSICLADGVPLPIATALADEQVQCMFEKVLFRVIVAGDRKLVDYAIVETTLDRMLANRLPNVVIISGAAPGADTLGERYAKAKNLPCHRFPADWKQGKKAGPARNSLMADFADACVVFDGGGPGSRSMVEVAKAKGLALRVIDIRGKLS